MLDQIKKALKDEHILLCAPLPLSSARIVRPYLLERCGIDEGSAVCFAIPYYVEDGGPANLSAYARPRDYHLFVRQLSQRLCDRLTAAHPQNKFAMFADHSPIDERHAAALSGLGIIGRHGMLITEPYSSYVFLGELITDAALPYDTHEIKYCSGCNACLKACPYSLKGGCLSALTQKKGELTAAEQEDIIKYGSVWGCDICSEACPHTVAARKKNTLTTPIPFFHSQRIQYLTEEAVASMDDAAFCARAYSWRGRDTIIRNIKLFEEPNDASDISGSKVPPRDTTAKA